MKHIRTPVRLPPPPLSTFRSHVLPHTSLPQLLCADLRHFHRQPNQITPTPLQGPHRAFRGFILKMAATSATSTVMSHTIRPKNVLNSRQKPFRPFRADFHPLRGARLSRPDPSRGRPRVEPVPVFLSFSTVRGSERCRLEARGFAPWLSRSVTSAHPRWRLGSCDGHWPSCPHVVWGPCGWRGQATSVDAPICECRDATRDVAISQSWLVPPA